MAGPKAPSIRIPPNTSGIGSEEDSLQNVFHLVPKQMQPDFGKYILNDGKVLRFEAVLVPVPGHPVSEGDSDRM